jgi:signal transduction histidine kinase/ligand-binding sensor domain-containing protein
MQSASGRGRGVFTHVALLATLVLAPSSAHALNPALDISQYAHTAWKVSDGFSKGRITCVAQTPDGYLWLGSEFGLLRFDGVRSTAWKPPAGQSLPGTFVRSLLAARDGTLWIGTLNGLASWKNARLTRYPELAGVLIDALLEDRDGTIWIGGDTRSAGRLCSVSAGTVHCDGHDGRFGAGVFSLYEKSDGTLWAGAGTDLWHWKPAPPAVHRLASEMTGLEGFAEGDGGVLLIGAVGGIRQFAKGRDTPYRIPSLTTTTSPRLLRDRDGGLWIGTTQGLLHIYQGRTDAFAESDGLSGNDVNRLFEDREGNIWVATENGLDRFRELAVSMISVKQGLSEAAWAVQAARDDGIWIGSRAGLKRWQSGHVTNVGNSRAQVVSSMFKGAGGRTWAVSSEGISYVENNRLILVNRVSDGQVSAMAEDAAGNLWIAGEHSLRRVSRSGREIEAIPWLLFGHNHASRLAADFVHGGLWLGFADGGVTHFADGQIREYYTAGEGLGQGRVGGLLLDRDGSLWVSTVGGLSLVRDGRVATLTSKNGLPCDTVHWMAKDDADSVWLYMMCGLVHLTRSEIDNWVADPKRTVHATVLDGSDGVTLHSINPSNYSPEVTKSSDGRLWFVSGGGVSILDPHHLPFNRLAPPVRVEQITADRTTYDLASDVSTRLPALTRDLQIDYTALSLVAPEKNRFQYKLEGYDRDWQDVGNRRQAFYTNLSPGSYRFRVKAANNSGVWNDTGGALDFSIAAAYYQTAWFRTLVVFAIALLLWAAYRYRLRQVAYAFDARLQERVNERTRIARELHDTLLQSFHGLLFRFQAVDNMLPDRPAEAKEKLEAAIDQAAGAITEARDAVQGLRLSAASSTDLAGAIGTVAQELAARQKGERSPQLRVNVEGTPRDLAPLVRDEAYWIACEALRNVFRHANASAIEVALTYDAWRFRLSVRDDGRGVGADVVESGGRSGHYGLAGMRERAELVSGQLSVWSKPGAGTEIELTIPAVAAYAQSSPKARPVIAETGT